MNDSAKNTRKVPVLIAEGIQKQLKTYARARKLSLVQLVEGILSEFAESTERLDQIHVKLVARKGTQPTSGPRRYQSRWREAHLVKEEPNRINDFEKVKTTYEFPGTYLDSECDAAESAFLSNWGAFSETEKDQLVSAYGVRSGIYSKWQSMHEELVAHIAGAEQRLAKQTGRAHRMTNARLRKLRAQLSEFEAKVRWNLRNNLKTM